MKSQDKEETAGTKKADASDDVSPRAPAPAEVKNTDAKIEDRAEARAKGDAPPVAGAEPTSLEERAIESNLDESQSLSMEDRVAKLEGDLATLKARLLHWL